MANNEGVENVFIDWDFSVLHMFQDDRGSIYITVLQEIVASVNLKLFILVGQHSICYIFESIKLPHV